MTYLKDTDELINEIKKSKDFESFMEANEKEMLNKPLNEYLNDLIEEKKISKSDVIRKSNLNRSYVYQILSGKKHPGRDKVIALSFGLSLKIDEIQFLLKLAGYRELYARDPRDALVIYAVENNYNIIDTNQLLYDTNLEVFE